MEDRNERCATPASPIPEHASTCGDGKDADLDLLCSSSSAKDGDDGGSSSTSDSSSAEEDGDGGSSSSAEDEDDNSGDSSEEDEEVNAGGSSVGTELALELARWKVEWVPEPEPTEEEKAVEALHVVRCRQFTEHDPKLGYPVPTRLCHFNIALFDFEKESMAGLGQPLCTLDRSDWMSLEDSINVVSLKITESDVGYPISVFGTVLARDQVDYKCVYLFRRDREDPQEITSPGDALTLTGPCRGLAATSHIFLEVDLKIRSDDGDKDFSKGLVEHWTTNDSHNQPIVTRLLTSWMSTLQLVYAAVPFALEATLAVNVLNLKGCSSFTAGRVTAWTSGNENRIVLHDSEAPGTVTAIGDGGSVPLSRCVVAVPVDEELVLAVRVVQWGGDGAPPLEFVLILGHGDGDERLACGQGSCELRVRVTWSCMLWSRRRRVFETVGGSRVLV